MGKRKSSAKPQKKIKQKLDITFSCLFCNHEKSVICTLDKKNSLGELHCKICGQSFQTAIHSLSQPVDVYSDWIDACEDLAEEAEATGTVPEEDNGEYSDEEYGDSRKSRDPALESDEDDY
ncbi:DEHA2E19360p [Debaryomyces hansenii CBS767]|jgi:transcription elongation factor Elf1|uniref:Transcription elongation factor 1 homolog n=1 Tax=Debaryomyces hansenii (strain ATCC 36239 / CBS 767 / BCRC 21394 / JCM 1990 / NBRC 0083 / IGC 2968) TaxID=284592 RepID=Q6BNS3_DEBHA|nr:DEHA2E19360p [Debaryomyces hansenii CBS767]CAG88420.1 DEHA2E19360p [Debaryomyces hansenii CBS767]|eukprot:XP_460147.1 DEHA2E19360p [Debaryomyces hansenii CBS767]